MLESLSPVIRAGVEEQTCRDRQWSSVNLWRNLQPAIPSGCTIFPPPCPDEGARFSTSSPAFAVSIFLMAASPWG